MQLVADSAETSEEESSWEGHSEDEEDGEIEVEGDAEAGIPTAKPEGGESIGSQAPAKKRASNALVEYELSDTAADTQGLSTGSKTLLVGVNSHSILYRGKVANTCAPVVHRSIPLPSAPKSKSRLQPLNLSTLVQNPVKPVLPQTRRRLHPCLLPP
jgi:hypothetical protein